MPSLLAIAGDAVEGSGDCQCTRVLLGTSWHPIEDTPDRSGTGSWRYGLRGLRRYTVHRTPPKQSLSGKRILHLARPVGKSSLFLRNSLVGG